MGPGEGGRERMRERNEWCSSGRLHFFPPTAHTQTHTQTPSVCMCSLLLKCHWVPGWNGVVAGRVEQGVSGGQTEINRWSGVQKWNESCDISERGPSKFTMLLRAFLHLHVSIKVWIEIQAFGYIWYRLPRTHIMIREVLPRLLWSVYDQENLIEKKTTDLKLDRRIRECSVQRGRTPGPPWWGRRYIFKE